MGFAVLTRSVIIKACALLPIIEQKSFMAQWMVIPRFLKKYSIVHRLGTKVSQHPPAEAIQEAMEFQQFIKPMLLGPERDLHFIINMDQTPVYFLMHPTRTLDVLGKKTIVIRTTTNDTKCATVALTITAAVDQLFPMVVYKGMENGHIKQRELALIDPTCIFETKANVWMDKRVMLHWVEDVFTPYISLVPLRIVTLILLDSYRCHIMALVVNVIQDLGCKVWLHRFGAASGRWL
jgi:hypothetical protein